MLRNLLEPASSPDRKTTAEKVFLGKSAESARVKRVLEMFEGKSKVQNRVIIDNCGSGVSCIGAGRVPSLRQGTTGHGIGNSAEERRESDEGSRNRKFHHS